MELKDLTAEAVMAQMDRQKPRWWLAWANQRELQEALDMTPEERRKYLRRRAEDRVMLVLQSAYAEVCCE